jgi:integrase
LAELPGVQVRALEFLALTGARISEVLGAKWDEMDMNARTWTIPSQRMMSGRGLVVPLSRQAVRVLEDLDRIAGTGLVFAFPRSGGQISRPSLAKVLHQLPVGTQTASSFRRAFRAWLSTIATQDQFRATMQFLSPRQFLSRNAFCRPRLDNGYAQTMQAWADFCKPEA